jgi:hypothetical protein
LLVLVAEAAPSQFTRLFKDVHVNELPAHGGRLVGRDVFQRRIANGFNVPIAQDAEAGAQRDNVGLGGYRHFLDRRIGRPIVDQGSSRVLEKRDAVEEAGSLLGDLRRAAEYGHGMAVAAAGRVVRWSYAIVDAPDFRELIDRLGAPLRQCL